MALFKPGFDHIAVGLRNSVGWGKVTGTTDFIFWPPQASDSDEQNHYMEFSVPDDAPKTCVVFEFAFYSPHAYLGALKIKDFEVMQKNDKAYSFIHKDHSDYKANYATTATTNVSEKKDVKAFELTLEINRKGEIGNVGVSTPYVIPTPNNGINIKGDL
jgi:hypothetical protein